LRQQRVSSGQIVNLSRGQKKAQRVAERVDEGVDLGGRSALAVADRLIVIFCWVRRRCAGGARMIVLSIMAYSLSASEANCSNTRCHIPFSLA
jgi:hypothetical protein